MLRYRALQRAAQQPAHSVGDSLPVAGLAVLEFAKTLHQIEELAVDLDRINRRSAMEPLAPTSGISGASLPKGGSFSSTSSECAADLEGQN
jgi:hypothetical protein